MKIAFVYCEMESLGIQYLSSILRNNGHSTKLFFDPHLFNDTVAENLYLSRVFDYSEILVEEIREYKPDLIGFSVLSTYYEWAKKLSRKIKEKIDVPIVFGGIHPTSLPGDVMKNEFIDFVIVGEGEYPLLELVNSEFRENLYSSIKSLCYKKNGEIICNEIREPIQDLDQVPFPDKDLFYDRLPHIKESYTILSGRGCPHSCAYCCNNFLNKFYNGKYLRRRSVGNTIAELKLAVSKYNMKNIFFDEILVATMEMPEEFKVKK